MLAISDSYNTELVLELIKITASNLLVSIYRTATKLAQNVVHLKIAIEHSSLL